MASKFAILACLQAFALQSVLSQVILPQYQPLLPGAIVDAVPNCGCGFPPVLSLPQPVVQVPQQLVQVPQQFAPTTVVQDSSVSNNLANALQLLVVSNLLSNTLPFNEAEIVLPYGGVVEQVPYLSNYYNSYAPVVPSCGCGGYTVPSCGCGGYTVPSCGCGLSAPSCGCGGFNGLVGIF